MVKLNNNHLAKEEGTLESVAFKNLLFFFFLQFRENVSFFKGERFR